MELFSKDQFRDKSELFAHLIENKDKIMARRKAIIKHADGIPFVVAGSGEVLASKAVESSTGILDASLIINTTNLLDSHKDVHIDGLWNKTMNENAFFDLNQEHKHGFRDIIADGVDLKAYVQTLNWKELGFNYEGNTQALTYDAMIKAGRNPYMFDQYMKGYVRNHSVEMYYMKQLLALDDPQYKEEYANYEKYFPMVVNKEAETEGYFFPVLEAKHVGGAAVTKGSNFATPVYNIKNEPGQPTPYKKPDTSTSKSNLLFYL